MSGKNSNNRTHEGHSKGFGSTSTVGGTPDVSGFHSEGNRAKRLSNGWAESIKRNPDKAFHFYMLRWPHTRKIGVHLQDWLTLAREHPETLSLEKARQQVNEWIERNRAALK